MTIRLLVVSAAGSGPDIVARMVGANLTGALGQQVVVDNRAGASGRIGAEIAARSVPDGYTLMLLSSQLAIVSGMYENLKYDLVKDFAPISLVGTTPFILLVNPSVPATSVRELVTLAKSRPGVLQYGSAGSGSGVHLAAELFRFMSGIKIMHVPYKGTSQALTGAMSEEVHMTFSVIPQSLPLIKSGKMRALGVTSSRRTPLVPDLPSISEFIPGYEFIGWYGLVAPAKTPPAILSKLNNVVVKAMNTSGMRERMALVGGELDVRSAPGAGTRVVLRVPLKEGGS